MSSADTKAHKTGPARLLTDEDVSAWKLLTKAMKPILAMIDYLDKFVERGVKKDALQSSRQRKTWSLPCGTALLQQS